MDEVCVCCQKPKANVICEVCEGPVCKKCLQILDQSTFSFLKEIPAQLSHTHYCGTCYDQVVAPELEAYEEVMGRANDVFVFFISQRKEIPLVKKTKDFFKVENCPDRDEAILRLAFFSAQLGYNAVIEVEVNSEKIRNGAYQTSRWSGTGNAAQVDQEKLDRQSLRNQIYR